MHVQFDALDFGGVNAGGFFFEQFKRVDVKHNFLGVIIIFGRGGNFDETARFELVGERLRVGFFVVLEEFFADNAVSVVDDAERDANRAVFEFANFNAVHVARADFADNHDCAAVFRDVANFRNVAVNFFTENFFAAQIIFGGR